jgi:outer membrane protein assembly factor BamA
VNPPPVSPTPAASEPGVHLTAADLQQVPAPMPMSPDAIAPVARSAGKAGEPKGLDFIAAPIPISNPTLGTGLAAVAAVLFPISKEDKVSPATTVGVGGLYTDNHSYAFGAAARVYFAEDHWRFLAGAAYGDIHYVLFPPGVRSSDSTSGVPIEQKVQGGTAEVLRRVTDVLFLGARYTYADTTLGLDAADADSETAPPKRDLSVALAALGLRAQTDSRDSTLYPREGTLFDLTANFYDEAFGGSRSYQSYKAAVNKYVSLGERSVLAARLSACDVRGDAPVFALCLFGSSNDLRGYEVGRYVDRSMFAAQAEYRLSLPERLGFFGHFGFVAFAGVGEVAPSFGDMSSDGLLPAGGVGVRYLLSSQSHINFRIDYAWGKAGSRGAYVGVGEAF